MRRIRRDHTARIGCSDWLMDIAADWLRVRACAMCLLCDETFDRKQMSSEYEYKRQALSTFDSFSGLLSFDEVNSPTQLNDQLDDTVFGRSC